MRDFTAVEMEHAGAVLTGLAIYPEDEGPFPAVLVMHNALGLNHHVRETARQLADLGYAAVATDMYGGGAAYGDVEVTSEAFAAISQTPDLLRQRVVAWFDTVRAMPGVDPDRLAAIGFCFGGTCVLELARSGADVRAVVSYHGILTTHAPAQPGAVKAQVFAFCGGKDPYAPIEHVEGLRAEMAAAGAPHTITLYGDAPHGFTDPASDSIPYDGIGYHPLADRLSWAGTIALLDALLAV